MTNQVKQRLGEILIQQGLISKEQLESALESKRPDQKLGDRLIEMGEITELQLIEILHQQLGIPHIRLHDQVIETSILNLVTETYAREHLVLPLYTEKNKLFVAVNDPLDYFVFNDLRLLTGFVIEPLLATSNEIKQAIMKHYDTKDFTDSFHEDPQDKTQDLSIEEESSPVVQLLNQFLQQAVIEGASDLHFDPQNDGIHVRFRIDGALQPQQVLTRNILSSLTTRIKIMSNLDITEQKIPQDGRIKRRIEGREIDLRVSTIPTIFGEKIVIRVLDSQSVSKSLKQIGFEEDHLSAFIKMIEKPHGIVLLTGPTGSGKTSTMYAALSHLNHVESNIITLEDPVEYQMNGVNQIQVNPKVNLTFASGLRSILRQDPDIIMLGEIRDEETANMAVRASITGHLVLSTLHTNDSLGAIDRLLNMGVEQFLIGTSINGIVAQRLIRTNCRDCTVDLEPTMREKEILKKYGFELKQLSKGTGCPSCRGTGYRGRMAIHEVLTIDDDLRSIILNDYSITKLERLSREKGLTYLFEDGLRKVAQGLTTIEEVFRVASE